MLNVAGSRYLYFGLTSYTFYFVKMYNSRGIIKKPSFKNILYLIIKIGFYVSWPPVIKDYAKKIRNLNNLFWPPKNFECQSYFAPS